MVSDFVFLRLNCAAALTQFDQNPRFRVGDATILPQRDSNSPQSVVFLKIRCIDMSFAFRRVLSLVTALLTALTLLGSLSGVSAENMTPVITSPAIAEPAPDARQLESVVPPKADVSGRPAATPKGKQAKKQAAQAPASLSHPFYIEFRSRHALSYGHTFLAHGRLGANGRILTQTIVGLHPAGDDAGPWMVGHVVPVPSETGPSDGDLEEEYISARYRIDLTPVQYENIVRFVNKLAASSPLWHAVIYNCNAFVGDVVKYMGMKHPPSLDFPPDFINGIRTMNGGVRTLSRLNEPQ